MRLSLLAVIPFLGMFAGPVLHDSTQPFLFGMPFLLGWTALWIVLTAIIMGVIYVLDPARRAARHTGR
jgi:ABC-type antimicrobial peptide transport system permease subunit